MSEPTPIVVRRWKCSARSPQPQEHEAVVSNVLEISTITGDELEFNAEVNLVLSHSAPGLQGYELVIKRLIDWESNEWEEVDGTEDLRCWQGFLNICSLNRSPSSQASLYVLVKLPVILVIAIKLGSFVLWCYSQLYLNGHLPTENGHLELVSTPLN